MLAEPVIGQKAERPGQIDAIHPQRAMAEIAAQHRLDIVVKVAERLHQIGHRRIARAVLVFGVGDLAVDHDLRIARQTPDEVAHRQCRRGEARLVDVADHQRPGIDERIARAAALEFQLHQRVERLARRLVAKPFPDRFAGVIDGLHQAEYLGNTLHRERRFSVAGAIHFAVVTVHGDAQLVGRHRAEGGNIVSNFALPDQGPDGVKDLVQQRLHAGFRKSRPMGSRGHWG